MEYQEENNYPKAFLLTGLIMAVLIGLCYIIIIHAPAQQVDGVGGILVNYGTTDEGAGSDFTSTEEPSAAEKPNKAAPDKVTPTPPTETPTPVDNSNQNVVTQNTEDAPVVAANTKKTTTTPVATQPAKPAPAKPVVNQNALYKGKTNTGTGAGDGTTTTPGNQGSPNGSTTVNNYGPGGSGNGLNLPNWQFVDPPAVKNINRVEGRVIVDFTIDDKGNVLEAHIDRKQTKAALDLVQSCIEAIKNSRFKSTGQASGNQQGRMSFIFKVD